MDRTPLDAEVLRNRLGERWARVDVVTETASTNADLLARATTPPVAPDRSVLVAEHQTAGRGRFDRTWVSPPGAGLTFSALFRPAVPIARWSWLPLLAGVALAEAVEGTAGVRPALKWPNDLLVDGRKAAGILVQTAQDAAVVGIGLNVTTTADELPVDTATSLGPDVDRTDLLVAILARLDARVAQWADVGGDAAACGLAAAYRERCATIGAQVRVSTSGGAGGNEVVTGTATEVDDDGHLVVDGRIIGAGDVEQVRRTG